MVQTPPAHEALMSHQAVAWPFKERPWPYRVSGLHSLQILLAATTLRRARDFYRPIRRGKDAVLCVVRVFHASRGLALFTVPDEQKKGPPRL